MYNRNSPFNRRYQQSRFNRNPYIPAMAEVSEEYDNCEANIVFQVTSRGWAFPIKDAVVKVYRVNGTGPHSYAEAITDISGKTPPICVDTPPRSTSLSPSLDNAFFTYRATITADGYEPYNIEDIQTFSGIKIIQTVKLNRII